MDQNNTAANAALRTIVRNCMLKMLFFVLSVTAAGAAIFATVSYWNAIVGAVQVVLDYAWHTLGFWGASGFFCAALMLLALCACVIVKIENSYAWIWNSLPRVFPTLLLIIVSLLLVIEFTGFLVMSHPPRVLKDKLWPWAFVALEDLCR